MTELGITEKYLVDKLTTDIKSCIESCVELSKMFSELLELDLEELIIDSDAKVMFITFVPVIEELSQRLNESKMIPMLGKMIGTIGGR